MNYEKFKKQFLKNVNGATFELNGSTAKNTKGYYCSITNNKFKSLTFKGFKKVYSQAVKMNNNKKVYIGYWKDQKNNTYYIDITLRFLNLNKALNIAKSFKQLAIWDIKNNSEITV